LFVGPVPENMHIDHLCCVRSCCNPAHLEPVTQRENNRRTGERNRAAGCAHGHAEREQCRKCRAADYQCTLRDLGLRALEVGMAR
jgi:hypothetical protein